MVLRGGTVASMDPYVVGATSIAVTEHLISAVGDDDQVPPLHRRELSATSHAGGVEVDATDALKLVHPDQRSRGIDDAGCLPTLPAWPHFGGASEKQDIVH